MVQDRKKSPVLYIILILSLNLMNKCNVLKISSLQNVILYDRHYVLLVDIEYYMNI